MDIPQGVLHRFAEEIFDPLKNIAIVTKIEQRGQSEVFHIHLQNR